MVPAIIAAQSERMRAAGILLWGRLTSYIAETSRQVRAAFAINVGVDVRAAIHGKLELLEFMSKVRFLISG